MSHDQQTSVAPMRIEHDSFGDIAVPAGVLWGAQTQRALLHFVMAAERMPVGLIRALARVKRAAATVNRDLGRLDPSLAEAIMAAARRVARTANGSSAAPVQGRAAPAAAARRKGVRRPGPPPPIAAPTDGKQGIWRG